MIVGEHLVPISLFDPAAANPLPPQIPFGSGTFQFGFDELLHSRADIFPRDPPGILLVFLPLKLRVPLALSLAEFPPVRFHVIELSS